MLRRYCGENPLMHGKNLQPPPSETPVWESDLWPSCYEVTALTTAPPWCPSFNSFSSDDSFWCLSFIRGKQNQRLDSLNNFLILGVFSVQQEEGFTPASCRETQRGNTGLLPEMPESSTAVTSSLNVCKCLQVVASFSSFHTWAIKEHFGISARDRHNFGSANKERII